MSDADMRDQDLTDDEPSGGDEGRSGGLFQDSLRKVLIGGASALLTTEEGIRSLIAERRLPKEALSYLLAQTDKTRKDMLGLLHKEVKSAVGRMDLAGELRRALTGLKLEVQASVRIVPDASGENNVQAQLVREPDSQSAHASAADDGASAAAPAQQMATVPDAQPGAAAVSGDATPTTGTQDVPDAGANKR